MKKIFFSFFKSKMPARRTNSESKKTYCELFGCENKLNRILNKVPRSWLKRSVMLAEVNPETQGYRCVKCKKVLCRNCVYGCRVKKCAFCNTRMNGTSYEDDKEVRNEESSSFMDDETPTSTFPYGVSRDYSPVRTSSSSSSSSSFSSSSSESDDERPVYRNRPVIVFGSLFSRPDIVNQSPSGSTQRTERMDTSNEDDKINNESVTDEKSEEIQLLKAINQSLEIELNKYKQRVKELEDYIKAVELSHENNIPQKRARLMKK